jgi:hypothetical protein
MPNRANTLFSAVLLLLLLMGCSSTPAPAPEPAAKQPNIYKVEQTLKNRLAGDQRLRGSNITFDFDGIAVILNGTVKDSTQFGWAATVAGGTPGVKSVINRLQIEPVKPPSAESESQAAKNPESKKPVPKTPTPESKAATVQTPQS